MSRVLLCASMLFTSLAWASDKPEEQMIDYEQLDLTATIKAMRAGNQDPTGLNSYYFKMMLYALPILKEEIKKPFVERLKIEKDLGEFGITEMKSLKIWQPDKKPNPAFSLLASGDVLREMVAEAMRNFKLEEDQVSVVCHITLYERAKKFGFWGDDTKVAAESFPIIPESLPHGPVLENRELLLQDKTGTRVLISIQFKHAHQVAQEPKAGEGQAQR